jgi:hypothetical protein
MSKPERNVALDLAKGSLVILMVFYHCASMTMLTPEYRKFATVIIQNINFIPQAFLVISGLLCGIHYLPQLQQDPEKTRRKLAVRSFKLILIFLSLNLILYSAGLIFSLSKSLNYSNFPSNMLFFLGISPGDIFAFEILYYIGFFLLVTSFILGRINLFYPLAVCFIINRGQIHTVWGLTFGFIGVLLGSLSENKHLQHFWVIIKQFKGLPIILLFFFFQLFFDEITIFFRSSVFFISTITYCFEIMLWLLSCVFILQILKIDKLNNYIISLGKYTLISYIIQMVIIRINCAILAKYIDIFYKYYILNVILTIIFLYCFVFMLDYVRRRNVWINKGYELIFA